MEVDLILCDVITNELAISATRVVVYNQNWKAPTDDALFIVVKTVREKIIGSNNNFDPDTNEEVKTVSSFIFLDIEITSKDRSALERKEEVLMSLTSTYSRRQQEDNNTSMYRDPTIIDLSEIDGSSALHRFRIPVIMTQIKIKRTVISPIDKFKETEIIVETN